MVWDTSIAKTSKKCNACQKEFIADETYFSSLAMASPASAVTASVRAEPAADTTPANQVIPTPDELPQAVTSKKVKPRPKVLVNDEQERFTRRDFCSACWEQSGAKQPDVFSFWQMKQVVKEQPKTPKEILLNFYDNMVNPQPLSASGSPAQSGQETMAASAAVAMPVFDPVLKSRVVYLFSLILIRKRLLKLKQTAVRENQRWLVLERTIENPKAALDPKAVPIIKTYEVPDIDIPPEELISLRDEFSRLFEFKI
ncbi:MAG: hypothetical protein WC980_05235 [Candidatus Brocadiia bacterium]